MKKLVIATIVASAAQGSFASGVDLRDVNGLNCVSKGLGSFLLIHLNSASPKLVAAKSNALEILERTPHTIVYRLLASGRKFTLAFGSSPEQREGVDGRLYTALVGEFINGDISSPIRCSLRE